MKRGDLAAGQIVLVVLAIAAFLVLGLFLWLLQSAADGGAQACKLSVLTRASVGATGGQSVPLTCATEKICMGERGATCAESMAGEDVTNIKLPKEHEKATTLIEATTAEAMYTCWDMMGKGQLDISTGYWESRGGEKAEPLCVICSRIAVDSDVSEDVLKKLDFSEYMRTMKVPGTGLTYLQAFSDKDVSAYPATPFLRVPPAEGVSRFDARGQQIAIVFMQVKTTSWGDATQNTLSDLFVGTTAAAGGAFYVAPVSAGLNAGRLIQVIGKNLKVFSIGVVVVGIGVAATQYFVTGASQDLAAGHCGLYAGSKNTQGCSVVQAVPYDAKAINALCKGNIEGVA